MHRLLAAAAPLALAFALPGAAGAQADGIASATPGALAGRSPHHAYRPAVAATACPASMHSLPAGKLPVYGASMVARPGCEAAVRIADKGSSSTRAAR